MMLCVYYLTFRFFLSFLLFYHILLASVYGVLGRPGSGCSTVLKTTTSHHKGYVAVSRPINYSGLTAAIAERFRGDDTYMGM